jgi:hypothetical protein
LKTGGRSKGNRIPQVLLRTVHILAMALVLGGLAMGGDFARLRTPILLTVLSGAGLFGLDLAKGPGFLHQGSGVAVLLKLALLGLGNLFPAARYECYLAATAVASVGSHMAGSWRHFSFLRWRVLGHEDPE